jgi:hypothetical protein
MATKSEKLSQNYMYGSIQNPIIKFNGNSRNINWLNRRGAPDLSRTTKDRQVMFLYTIQTKVFHPLIPELM